MTQVTDPHHTFAEWLTRGALDEPPRDAALHASVCPECLRRVAAFDALAEIDVGRALLPASRVGQHQAGRRSAPSLRWASAAVVGLMGIAIVGLSAPRLFAGMALPSDGATGAVLAAVGTPAPTASAAASDSGTAAATRQASTTRPSETTPGTPAPTVAPRPRDTGTPTPLPHTPPPATPTPRTPAPTTPAPTETPATSPPPTATPTTTPTSTPTDTSHPTGPPPTPTPTASETGI